MAAKSSEWRPGPTVCRCCLTEGCYKDISTEYFWMGKREVYAEMLKDTLDVSIAYSKAGGPNSNSRLICEPCISRLRDATEFKRQVVECERMFMQHLDPGSSSLNVDLDSEPLDKIKIEGVKLEKGNSDDDFDDRQDFGLDDDDDDDDDDLDNQPLTKLASKVPKKESVDLLDLLDNSKAAEKRKASTKAKAPPPKKAKAKVEPPKPKPTSSKPKPEKKKKGDPINSVNISRLPSTITIRKIPQRTVAKVPQNIVPMKTLRIPITIKREPPESTKTKKEFLPISTIIKGSQNQINSVIKKNLVTKKQTFGKIVVKPLQVRRKNRSSCVTLLKNTTLCPFKYSRGAFACLYCVEEFPEIAHLEDHLKQHELITEEEIAKFVLRKSVTDLIKVNVREYKCRICNDVMEDMNALKEHLINKHTFKLDPEYDGVILYKIDKNNFECAHCGIQFVKYRLLNIHVKEHYIKFFCEQCGTGFITSNSMKVHLKSHETGSHPCNVCGKVYKNEISRDEHHRSVHKRARKNVCNICREGFHSYYRKLRHMKEVHNADVPTYKCNFCPKVFLMNSYWKNHEKMTHLKSACYTCDICDYKHHNKSSLKRHMIVHSNEKHHKCSFCGKSYARQSTLREHLRIHNDDRRFKCNYCDRAFVQKCSLKGHMKTHHKDVIFE